MIEMYKYVILLLATYGFIDLFYKIVVKILDAVGKIQDKWVDK